MRRELPCCMGTRGDCCESQRTHKHKVRYSSRPIVLTTTFFVSIQGLVKVVLSRIKSLSIPFTKGDFLSPFGKWGFWTLASHTSASQESFKRLVLGLRPSA